MAIQKPSHTFTKIHLKALHTNNFYILFALSFTVFINTFGFAQDIPRTGRNVSPETNENTITVQADSLQKLERSIVEQDSTIKDTIKPKPELLASTVTYTAKDYTSFNNKEQKLYLYNEAEVHFEDMELKAGIIVIDYNKNEVYAGRIKDSSGIYTQRPSFKQGNDLVEPDSIRFNYKTKKALIFKSKTEQQGMQIYAPITKKENDSVIFLYKGRFTTSTNIENPEYYFQASRIKLVPGKKIVVGLTNMVIADVPTPLGLPFGFFPLTKTQTSGVLIPSFGEQNSRGYFLQNGGYYFAISDFVDLAVLGDYYTNGSYGLRFESDYALRYKFGGNLGFRYENLINSERGFPDYSKTTIYNIRWSHSQDTKSSPNSRFSASVNLGSSKYYKESDNQVNIPNYLNNTMASSVSYSKTFQGEPQVNMTAAATHSQNTNTEQISMALPTVQASVGRVYPFEPKIGAKKGAFENINLQYNIIGENRFQTTDSLFFKKEMWDDAKNGISHTIPLTTNFKVFKHFSISATTNYKETWSFKTVEKYYDQVNQEVIINENKGFEAYRTYDFLTSVGTTVYGMFQFEKEGEDKKIKALRHVMRPSISYMIKPAFDRYFDTYEVISADGLTTKDVEYSKFDGSVYGAPNGKLSNTIGFSLGNNIEMKVRDRDSTKIEARKIKLLDNLNIATGYNIAADSLGWDPVRISGSTQLLKDKMSVNFSAVLNPYGLDNNNNLIDTWNIDNGGSLFRLTNANVTMNYTISNTTFSGGETKESNQESLRSGGRDDDLFGRSKDFADQSFYDDDDDVEKTPSDLYTSVIPWSLRLAYVANYTNFKRENEISSQSLMFSGDVELSPRWKVGASSGYDFKNKGFSYTSLRFERDLLSWRMSLNWIPFSNMAQWNFFIGIKSNLLKDIKYEKRRKADKRL